MKIKYGLVYVMPKKKFMFERLWYAVEYNSKWVRPLLIPMHVGLFNRPFVPHLVHMNVKVDILVLFLMVC
jgi:hypothetical protein